MRLWRRGLHIIHQHQPTLSFISFSTSCYCQSHRSALSIYHLLLNIANSCSEAKLSLQIHILCERFLFNTRTLTHRFELSSIPRIYPELHNLRSALFEPVPHLVICPWTSIHSTSSSQSPASTSLSPTPLIWKTTSSISQRISLTSLISWTHGLSSVGITSRKNSLLTFRAKESSSSGSRFLPKLSKG